MLKNRLEQLIIFVYLMNSSIGSFGTDCPGTKHENITVDRGEPARLKVYISPMWPFLGEDLVLRNDEGVVVSACTGKHAFHHSNVLHNITCWSGEEMNGLALAAERSSCIGCTVNIVVTLTENSKSGVYFLELQETACQFWVGHIFFRDFNPTCTSLFLRESLTLRFSCQWFITDQKGKAWLKNKVRTLHESYYNGVANIDGNLTNSISMLIDLDDVFSESKVPDRCAVSQFGFEQNCTFSPVVQLIDSKSDDTLITNAELNCCIGDELKPEIWVFNLTHAIAHSTTRQQYIYSQAPNAGRNKSSENMFGILCCQSTTDGIIVYIIGTLTLKNEVLTISLNASRRNKSNHDSTCVNNYIINIEKALLQGHSTQSSVSPTLRPSLLESSKPLFTTDTFIK